MGTSGDVLKYSALSGLFFYVYNEASFLALDRLSPVSHSVANTLKRVLIIVATCVVFKTPISTLGMVGSGIAVLVSFLFSLFFIKFYISFNSVFSMFVCNRISDVHAISHFFLCFSFCSGHSSLLSSQEPVQERQERPRPLKSLIFMKCQQSDV